MNANKLTNLLPGSSGSDSCTYGQLTTAIASTVSNPMTADLSMASHKITNLSAASSDTDVPQWG